MGLIKDIYSREFYEKLAHSLLPVLPLFNKKAFLKDVLKPAFAGMEWKERMKHTASGLHQYMPPAYPEAAQMLIAIIRQLKVDGIPSGRLEYIFLADYVESYGLDHFEPSMKALEQITQFISCEFAVRPFLLRYGNRMMDQMLKWSQHKSAAVRRLASEGSRPRLPWAMAIPALKKDPTSILPILEHLKQDSSESVRRSVANNLNDIAKDHPDEVLAIATKWKGITKETDAIIKHGCRTLLKQGHPAILLHYGLDHQRTELSDFWIATPVVQPGGHLEFSVLIGNKDHIARVIRLEYALYFKRANGQLSRKVFKISEREYQPGEQVRLTKKHSFRPITTRKYYPGGQRLAVLLNGTEKASEAFELMV